MKNFLDNLIEEKKITVTNSKSDQEALREAYRYAYKNSTDSNTKTGAVILLDKEVVARGTNKFAENVRITEKRNTPISKRVYQDHSERNAVYEAAKVGIPLDNSEIYSTWIPCPACTNAIINSSINKLVFHYDMAIKTGGDWSEDLKESIEMLLEAGVEISAFKGKVRRCRNLFKGKIWRP